jgi:hypothetical protein
MNSAGWERRSAYVERALEMDVHNLNRRLSNLDVMQVLEIAN